MFTIDLLKGKGIPENSGPAGMAIAAATFTLPIVIVLFIFGSYVSGKIKNAIKEGELKTLQAKVNNVSLEDAVKNQKRLENEKQLLNNSLTEVSSSISGHTQWSPVLVAIIQNIPQNVVLRTIEVKYESRKIKRPKDDDSGKTVEAVISVRTLHLSMVGTGSGNYDRDVKAFRDALMADSYLAQRLDNIRVAQEMDKVKDTNIVSYEIYLIFKPDV
jgi:hypothetical protein